MARPRTFDLDSFLDAAMAVFWARGFANTSMADVYAATGLGPGSVYAVVKDKDDLFRRVFERYAEMFYATMRGPLTGYEALEAWLDQQIAFLAEDPERKGCLIANTIMEREAHSDQTRALAEARLAEVRAFFRGHIVSGQANGSIDAGLDPDTAADALLGSIIGLMALARGRAPREMLERIGTAAKEGLRGRPAASS
jgi:TetR/AcrR family transcriptional repressor of nem operon